jgi:hypothetical protein
MTDKMSQAELDDECHRMKTSYINFDRMLLKADGACLLYEVVWFALWHMKKNPKLSEEAALELGFHEWVK